MMLSRAAGGTGRGGGLWDVSIKLFVAACKQDSMPRKRCLLGQYTAKHAQEKVFIGSIHSLQRADMSASDVQCSTKLSSVKVIKKTIIRKLLVQLTCAIT